MSPGTLGRLRTDLGERSTYDAASQCSRCGYCEQACPTYVATGEESKSPRGRNQLLRLIIEGRLEDPASAAEAFSSCLLCGACQTACYAHVPTPDLVAEARRLLPARRGARVLAWLMDRRERLGRLLKLAFLAKRMGLAGMARPLLRALGGKGLVEAEEALDDPPRAFLDELLRGRDWPAAAPSWRYFSACGTNFLFPKVGLATTAVLSRGGPGRPLGNGCCGLLAYNYGALEDARRLARAVIEKDEASGDSPAPIVGDCSSCVAFLKSYPQLFLGDGNWRSRAERFAAKIKDALEVLPTPSSPVRVEEAAVYHESCRACHGQGVRAPRGLLRALFGDAMRDLPEADVCCGGAGAFSLSHPELSDEILRHKARAIASTGAKVVLASSTSCLLQLGRGMAKYHPSCRVEHVSEVVHRSLAG